MTTLTSTYRFLPWARRGLASRIAQTDTGAPLPVRAKISVGLTVTGSTETKYDLSVYGPGDVLGIDTTLIVRTEPRSNATDVESNYFPAIEFDAPDFPWLFTPAASGSNDRKHGVYPVSSDLPLSSQSKIISDLGSDPRRRRNLEK